MDIPNSGAIFTLGKSHLAENTQSYFYIKNDPVRRLTSGANQSAVICESGRLFVWGENHFGQLGVGTSSSGHSEIITKPTCVKSLKTLGLKIADIAFGNGWAVILAYSNEVFFTGRSIFSAGTKVSENFTTTTVGAEKCSIIRKPFRLEEFDDCLSTSEDQENFTCISAGNGHFAVMTSLGRLIGWGSNEQHQLGSNKLELEEPYEIVLESKVKQFVCGPTSTLILTESGNLYLTGRLSEMVFPQFTELQKNLSPQEEIVFMHISQASEIYIVTNEGGIYRSMESSRYNSLIFQRFYDYDSEENGQLVKLLRGTSFYAVLTKANKFYTTFSESGHHLKTFREISKFKNLRTLDMVVGDQHILVHGIPRTANKLLNKTFVIRPDSNANIHQMPGSDAIQEENEGGEENANTLETLKPNTPEHSALEPGHVNVRETENTEEVEVMVQKGETSEVDVKEVVHVTVVDVTENIEEPKSAIKMIEEMLEVIPPPSASSSKDFDALEDSSPTSMKSARYRKLDESEADSNSSTPSKKTVLTANADSTSPDLSVKSRKGSARSIRFDEKSLVKQNSSERVSRPRTPYPDGIPQETQELLAENEDSLDKTSPAFNDSLENIPKTVAGFEDETPQRSESAKSKASTKKRKLTPLHRAADPVMSSEEDEQLAVEISSTDFLNKTVVNEIRFINNGVDVTDKVSKKILPKIDSVGSAVEEEATKELEKADEALHSTIDELKVTTSDVVETAAQADKGLHSTIDEVKMITSDVVESAVGKVSEEADKTVESAAEKVDKVASETESTFGKVTSKVGTAMDKVSSEVGKAAGVVSNKFDSAISTVSEGVDNTFNSVSQGLSSTATKISTKVEDAKQNLSELFAGGNKGDTPNRSSDVSPAVTVEAISTPKDNSKLDDDERTTVSVNSNLTGSGNPFENENENFEPVKHDLGHEIREASESGKGKVKQFFSDMKAKGKGMSCRDEKAIRVEDEPPKYTPVDEYTDNGNKTSKVCTIL